MSSEPNTASPPKIDPERKNQLVDRFGRAHTALRVSVTDRCNLRCRYCMPADGVEFLPREDVLSYEQLTRAIVVGNRLGIRRIRITGGEPLLRRDLAKFVAMIREQTDVEDISLTTNGLLLDRHAQALADAGLDRINVSLDSMQPERFETITRFGGIEKVWSGIEAASEAGLSPIKINALILEGFNEDEIPAWIDLVRRRDVTVRFMELMPVGANSLRELGSFYDLTKLRERLEESHGIAPADGKVHVGNGPARYWKADGWAGALGFITPMSNRYCNTCSRLRLTCTGELRSCLAFDDHVKLEHAIRRDDTAAIEAAFLWSVETKQRGHHWQDGETTETGMSQVGG
ncbi:MAG: GTP 3',8-cyclase MoaA [Myxococcota bacterium]